MTAPNFARLDGDNSSDVILRVRHSSNHDRIRQNIGASECGRTYSRMHLPADKYEAAPTAALCTSTG